MKLVETLKALKLEEKQKLESIKGLGESFYTPKINIDEAEKEQINLSEKISHNQIINLDQEQQKVKKKKHLLKLEF